MQSVPAVGQVKAAEQTKKIWRKDLVLSEQRELGDSSKLPPMVVDGGARFYDGTPDIDAPDVCKCVAVGTADARRPARLVVPDVERVLVGDRYPEGRTEESNSRSVWIADPGGSNRSVSVADLSYSTYGSVIYKWPSDGVVAPCGPVPRLALRCWRSAVSAGRRVATAL